MSNLHNIVYARLDAIASAEKITRVELAALSREALTYVTETHDIDLINRLIGVLTPVNRKVSILYFRHFLPWEVEENNKGEFERFGKMLKKDKAVKRKMDLIAEWLAEEGNTIWVWQNDNVDLTKKKDFAGTIKKAVEKALKGDEKSGTEPLSRHEIMMAVMLGGFTMDDMLEALTDADEGEEPPKEENKEEAA